MLFGIYDQRMLSSIMDYSCYQFGLVFAVKYIALLNSLTQVVSI